jgi:signal transduction histidine kinase
MAERSSTSDRQALAAHLHAQIPALLAKWRTAIAADWQLLVGESLPRSQLEDHIPEWLEAFADEIATPPAVDAARVDAAEAQNAKRHGLQRWQLGYDLHQVTREWGALHRCVAAEIERFAADRPPLSSGLLSEVRLMLIERVSEAIGQSAQEYFRLERIEAAGTVRELEEALSALRALDQQRAEIWQHAAHDLRGNLGVVANAAHGLSFESLPAERRQDFLVLLRNNITSLRHMLDDVTGLARLHAGQEHRSLETFDAAELLRRLAEDIRGVAEQNGLFLQIDGPPSFYVEGDRVKVRRIAQNLLLNAVKYTDTGGVYLRWGDTLASDDGRWRFSVEDTGPGVHTGSAAPIVDALTEATGEARSKAPDPLTEPSDSQPAPGTHNARGEGLGLAIVKRLSELLDGAVEMESRTPHGTTVRVLLPRRYNRPG